MIALAIAEQIGMSRQWIGYWFLFATIALYAMIGIMSRTVDAAEYYVAGRRVPAFFNGMATGADWMSAASFIGMAGTLYLSGYDGLAFVMGWTGGYVLVALFLAPYLRKFGQFTIPDFLGARYGGNIVRSIGIFAAILCSFTYVVAQIYGVGIITSKFTGLEFGVGVFVGLAGILVCSFLGGMRAVTWTQVAQYIILIIAYLTPVVWLGVKHTGIPVPQFAYGAGAAEGRRAGEEDHRRSEGSRRRAASRRPPRPKPAAALKDPVKAAAERRAALEQRLAKAKADNAPDHVQKSIQQALTNTPTDPDKAKEYWSARRNLGANANPPRSTREPFPGRTSRRSDTARLNFLGIVFCMMFGTAALPHILMRYYTTPSVRQARTSVFWSLFFIFLLYFTAPCLAVLAKFDVYSNLVGSQFAELPAWAAAWRLVDPALLTITDLNFDGIVQLAEIAIGGDIIVLATPEIAGLPYVVSGLVAAGGLAAALSTADGLLLTIANALSHDLYYKMIDPQRLHGAPRYGVEDPAAGGRVDRRLGDLVQAGEHPVPGRCGVLARGIGVLPGTGAGHLLEACQQMGRDHRHAGRTRRLHVLHERDLSVLPRLARGYGADRVVPVVRHERHLGRRVRRAGWHATIFIVSLLTPEPRRRSRNWSSTCATRTWRATSRPAAPERAAAPIKPAQAGFVIYAD